MMKKLSILLVVAVVVCLSFSYKKADDLDLAQTLITDAYYGDLTAVKNDLEEGADINYELYFDDTERGYRKQTFNILQAAASSGNEDLLIFLLDNGLDINFPTQEGWTPLFIAARDGQAEAAKLLIYKQADLNAQTDLGATALLMAVTQPFESEEARMDLLKYMLKRGANPNLKDIYGNKPLHYAEKQGKTEIVSLLKKYTSNK